MATTIIETPGWIVNRKPWLWQQGGMDPLRESIMALWCVPPGAPASGTAPEGRPGGSCGTVTASRRGRLDAAPESAVGGMSGTSGDPLVLVPTERERQGLAAAAGRAAWTTRLELAGFGPVAAAARTATLLAHRRPPRVLLVGLAGALDPERARPGQALAFGRVTLEGVGAGEGEGFLSAGQMGFPLLDAAAGPSGPVGEELDLVVPDGLPENQYLLTVCAASGNPLQAGRRRARHPDAVAEDMESFGVALACTLAGIPLTVVRGISNRSGDRERGNWCFEDAYRAIHERVEAIL